MSASSHSSDDGESADMDDTTSAKLHTYGFSSRERVSSTRFRWKSEEEDPMLSFSVPEESEEEATRSDEARKQEHWDGMEMEMEMD